ncbi:MAG: hypothetical protein ABSB49_14090, partial [Polyangia bacterium]
MASKAEPATPTSGSSVSCGGGTTKTGPGARAEEPEAIDDGGSACVPDAAAELARSPDVATFITGTAPGSPPRR